MTSMATSTSCAPAHPWRSTSLRTRRTEPPRRRAPDVWTHHNLLALENVWEKGDTRWRELREASILSWCHSTSVQSAGYWGQLPMTFSWDGNDLFKAVHMFKIVFTELTIYILGKTIRLCSSESLCLWFQFARQIWFTHHDSSDSCRLF